MKPTMRDLKYHNPLFFSHSTSKFFGKEKRKIVKHSSGSYYLKVHYLEKCPRITYWHINENDNFDLVPCNNPFKEE